MIASSYSLSALISDNKQGQAADESALALVDVSVSLAELLVFDPKILKQERVDIARLFD